MFSAYSKFQGESFWVWHVIASFTVRESNWEKNEPCTPTFIEISFVSSMLKLNVAFCVLVDQPDPVDIHAFTNFRLLRRWWSDQCLKTQLLDILVNFKNSKSCRIRWRQKFIGTQSPCRKRKTYLAERLQLRRKTKTAFYFRNGTPNLFAQFLNSLMYYLDVNIFTRKWLVFVFHSYCLRPSF